MSRLFKHIICLLAVVLYTVFCTNCLFAQCGNTDFETGDFTGWTAQSGCFNPTITMSSTGVNPTRHAITSGTGFDPIVPSIPVVSPYGGSHSVKLGNNAVGWGAERLSYTFNVDPNNALFTYQYAVIFQDPTNGTHTDAERPSLDVQIKSSLTGDTIDCGYYHVISHANIPGYQYGGTLTGAAGTTTNGCLATTATANQDVWYKNWTLVAIDLTPYIGTSIIVEFTTTDCSQGGHFGYAYLDAYCGPLQISGHFCPGDPNTTLTAPPGFSGYLWSTGQTTQSIVAANPTQGDTVRVTCIPFQGGMACATTLYYVFQLSPTVQVDFDVDDLCGAANVQFVDVSSVASGGGNINHWNWFIDGTLVDTTSSMNHTFSGAGTYTITLISSSDAGCPDTLNREIVIPPGLEAVTGASAGNSISCFGASDGYVTVRVLSGNPPYTYAWNNGAYNIDSVSGLPPGTYTIVVTDSAGCQFFDTIALTQPPPIRVAPTTEGIACYGGTDGKIWLNASGGVQPLTYTWAFNTLINSDSVAGLTAGSYSFTITDAKGCTFDSVITLVQPPTPIQVQYTFNDVACFGGNDGSISITSISGNVGTTTFLWNTFPTQTTASISSLPFGTYTCTVTDSRNCKASLSQNISQPPQLLVDLPKTDVRCFGESNGSITAVVSGGTFPYSYSWSTGSTAYAIPNIPIGNYSVTVTDNHLCSVAVSMEIIQPSLLTVSVSSINEKCYGGTSARAIAQPLGGSPPYYYAWSTTEALQQEPIVINLAAGNYAITITDSHACTATDSTTITEPPPLSVSIVDFTDNICYEGHTGTATASASGGSLPYTYHWNSAPPQDSATAINLAYGTYNVMVKDDSMCTAYSVVDIAQPLPIIATYLAEPVKCYDSTTGTIAIFLHNGTPAYSYTWNPNVSNSDSALNLASGNYTVTITDANGCSKTLSNIFVSQPPEQTIEIRQKNPDCYGNITGSSITIQASGGTPGYQYSLWQNGSLSGFNLTGIFSDLDTGTYTAQYVDSNNCLLSQQVIIAEPTPINTLVSTDSANCFDYSDGQILLTASGGTSPYQYVLNNGEQQNAWGLFSNLHAGEYDVKIHDANHCTLDTTIEVYEPLPIDLYAIPDSLVITLGETGTISLQSNYSGSEIWYQWSPDYGLDCSTCSEVAVFIANSGYYTVVATTHPNKLDCTVKINVPVTVIPNYNVYVPDAFTPNGNGVNDYYEIFGNKNTWLEMRFRIFNRWGEKVFESTDPNFKWDGTFQGEKMQPMVFVYEMELTFIDGYTMKPRKGSITLIR